MNLSIMKCGLVFICLMFDYFFLNCYKRNFIRKSKINICMCYNSMLKYLDYFLCDKGLFFLDKFIIICLIFCFKFNCILDFIFW